jgi:Tfp pilus assembly protein PilP
MTKRLPTLVGFLQATLAVPLLAWAQAAAQKPAAPPPKPAPPASAAAPAGAGTPVPPPAGTPAPARAGTPAPPPADLYSYTPNGRRDPFVSLIARGAETAATGRRAEGLTGLTTADLMVRGVLQMRGAYVALVQGPDGRTFPAHVNDRLADGTIRSITPQGLVIMQEVNDPLSLVKQKEVRKGLKASDDGKQ